MKEIHVVTGSRGSGKSTAVANFLDPDELSKAFIVDTEDSLGDIVKANERLGLAFGEYVRAYERFRPDADLLGAIARERLPWVSDRQKAALVEYWEWFVETLDRRLKPGTFTCLGIDTVEPIEAAMTVWAETHRRESGWSGSKAYGRLETEAVRPLYENLLEAVARRGVRHIVLASHLRRVWEGERPVLNKVQPGGRLAVLSRLSTAMFWLVQADNADGAPAAIVLKARQGLRTVVDGRWRVRRALPRRIPHFTWNDVRHYEQHGCDLRIPAPGETPTPDELAMISELLTDEQMRLMVLGAELELAQTAVPATLVPPGTGLPSPAPSSGGGAPPDIAPEKRQMALSMLAQGATPPAVAVALNVPLVRVIELQRRGELPA